MAELKVLEKIPRSSLTAGKGIGIGGFGNVIKAVLNEKPVAVKILHSPVRAENYFEFNSMFQLNHRNLIKMLGIVDLEYTECPQLVFVQASKGNLLQFVEDEGNPFEPDILNKLASDVIEALEYLHSMFYVHRSLAARNVLIDLDGKHYNAKLSDYGISRVIEGQGGNYYKVSDGTTLPIRWVPKECIPCSSTGVASGFTFASDIWSFGVVLYEMWSKGEVPYGADKSNTEVRQLILNGNSPITFFRPQCPAEVTAVMENIFRENPVSRPPVGDLKKSFDVLRPKNEKAEAESDPDVENKSKKSRNRKKKVDETSGVEEPAANVSEKSESNPQDSQQMSKKSKKKEATKENCPAEKPLENATDKSETTPQDSQQMSKKAKKKEAAKENANAEKPSDSDSKKPESNPPDGQQKSKKAKKKEAGAAKENLSAEKPAEGVSANAQSNPQDGQQKSKKAKKTEAAKENATAEKPAESDSKKPESNPQDGQQKSKKAKKKEAAAANSGSAETNEGNSPNQNAKVPNQTKAPKNPYKGKSMSFDGPNFNPPHRAMSMDHPRHPNSRSQRPHFQGAACAAPPPYLPGHQIPGGGQFPHSPPRMPFMAPPGGFVGPPLPMNYQQPSPAHMQFHQPPPPPPAYSSVTGGGDAELQQQVRDLQQKISSLELKTLEQKLENMQQASKNQNQANQQKQNQNKNPNKKAKAKQQSTAHNQQPNQNKNLQQGTSDSGMPDWMPVAGAAIAGVAAAAGIAAAVDAISKSGKKKK